jgi:hypothetical protein
MTPMQEKFLQKRFEEQSIVFSHNSIKDITQVEHHGFKFYVETPCFYCPLCGTSKTRCNCGVEDAQ